MAKQLATEMAPPFNLVAHFMLAGGFFYALVSFILPFYASYLDSFFVSSTIAAVSHLFLLGFVMMIIFGAMYQLIPVILEIPLFSKDFAYVQFYIFVVGLSLMSFGFFFEENYLPYLTYGALMVYISMIIFTVNIFLTYKNIEEWSIPAKYILASNIFLFLGVSFGLLAALNMQYGFLSIDMMSIVKAHIGGVLLGYVFMTIVGVAMVLIPMFSLSHGFDDKYVDIGFYFIVAGVILYVIGNLTSFGFLAGYGSIAIAISVGLFIYQMKVIFDGKVRKEIDFWAKNMIASFFFLIGSLVIFALGYLFGYDRFFLLGGYFLFFGFLVNIIVGHINKILPFLVWYQRFAPLVGKQKVPMLNDMVVIKVADRQFFITLYGTLISGFALLFGFKYLFVLGTLGMVVGAVMVIYNMYYTLVYEEKKK